MEPPYYCYLLQSTDGKTYVGVTIDLNRRLRQHNGEICGGASATRGGVWRRILHVAGFPSQGEALRFEWAWKHISRRAKGATSLERRLNALSKLLASERSTKNALAFAEYPTALVVNDERLYSEPEVCYELTQIVHLSSP